MPNVQCISIQGFRIFFWSADHRPSHFHVEKVGEWEIAVNIETSIGFLDYRYVTRNKNKGIGRIEKEILELLTENRAELLKEWEEKVQITEIMN